MPINYSKWDALELSDDSDIEVHPNVDKRSFIRAKQNQIHQEREHRKLQIATLKYERVLNDGFLKRIEGLLTALKNHEEDAKSRNIGEVTFQALMESADPDNDIPPPKPAGVHTNDPETVSYNKMIATLVDQVTAAVNEKKPAEDEKFKVFLDEINGHITKIIDLQKELETKLAELEAIEARKITSESIHTGFDSSSVNKSKPKPAPAASSSKSKVVEVLNPGALKSPTSGDSGADADIDEPAGVSQQPVDSDDEEVSASAIGKKFAAIKIGDYRACLNYISEHPSVVAESESDGILIMGLDAELAGKSEVAKRCVHQALLLQYCRTLGRDGVGLFFKRITTPGHQAMKVFMDDVNSTYERIHKRAKEIVRERAEEEEKGGVEQIQLHAVEPGTEIKVFVPPVEFKTSQDPEEVRSREIFESFSPGLRRALESGKLDEVNKVLGKMSVDEAEEIVAKLGEGGMLSLGEKVIDMTTEEGKEELKRIEEEERREKEALKEQAKGLEGYAPDPE